MTLSKSLLSGLSMPTCETNTLETSKMSYLEEAQSSQEAVREGEQEMVMVVCSLPPENSSAFYQY